MDYRVAWLAKGMPTVERVPEISGMVSGVSLEEAIRQCVQWHMQQINGLYEYERKQREGY